VMQVRVEDGVVVGEGVETGCGRRRGLRCAVAELTYPSRMISGVGGDFKIDGFALDDFDGLAAEEAGDEELFNFGRRGDDGEKVGGGVGADGDGDFETRAFEIAESNLGQAADGTVGDGDRASGGFSHGGDSGKCWICVGGGCSGGAHGVAIVFGGYLLTLASACRCLAIVDLHAIHADVALAGAGVAGVDAGQR